MHNLIIYKHDHECNKAGLGICEYIRVRRTEIGRGTAEEKIDWAISVYVDEKEEAQADGELDTGCTGNCGEAGDGCD